MTALLHRVGVVRPRGMLRTSCAADAYLALAAMVDKIVSHEADNIITLNRGDAA
jgi:hypothetical protein